MPDYKNVSVHIKSKGGNRPEGAEGKCTEISRCIAWGSNREGSCGICKVTSAPCPPPRMLSIAREWDGVVWALPDSIACGDPCWDLGPSPLVEPKAEGWRWLEEAMVSRKRKRKARTEGKWVWGTQEGTWSHVTKFCSAVLWDLIVNKMIERS